MILLQWQYRVELVKSWYKVGKEREFTDLLGIAKVDAGITDISNIVSVHIILIDIAHKSTVILQQRHNAYMSSMMCSNSISHLL